MITIEEKLADIRSRAAGKEVVGVYRISVLKPVYEEKESIEASTREAAQKYAMETYGAHGWAEFVTRRIKGDTNEQPRKATSL